MNSKNIDLNCMIPKAVKRWLAWILAVAMIFSGIPLKDFGGGNSGIGGYDRIA